MEADGPFPGSRPTRRWSVAAHLGSILLVAAVSFAGLAGVLAIRDRDAARRHAVSAAGSQSKALADVIGGSLADAMAGVAHSAATPNLSVYIDNVPNDCSLTGQGEGIFSEGHIDLVRLGGVVTCSSLVAQGAPPGAAYADRWVATIAEATGPFVTAPFPDTLVDGRTSIAIGAPLARADGSHAGAFVTVVHVDNAGVAMAEAYGGPDHYEFQLVDAANGVVITDSTDPTAAGTAASLSALWSDGVERLVGTSDVPGAGWQLRAGIETATAFAAADAAFRRNILMGALALGILVGLGLLLNRRIARPLRMVTRAVEQATREVTPAPVTPSGPAEIANLVERFNEMIATRTEHEARLVHQSFHDPLTGMPNRALFVEQLRAGLERAEDPASVAVLMIDVDRFKMVNDAIGHDAGDRVLLSIADRLPAAIRPGDTIARFGGDRFLLLCEGLISPEQASTIADRVRRCFVAPFTADDTDVTLSASIGIALGGAGSKADELLRDADVATSRAKALGRQRIEFFDDALRGQLTDRLRVESEIRHALATDEFVVHYQPEIDLRTGSIVAAEALVRWRHPTKGTLLPMSFIPLAEESDLIVSLGRLVLVRACMTAARWAREGHPIGVSVNLSPRELARPDLVGAVADVIAESGIEPGRLCIEITESTLMNDPAAVEETLRRLKELGVRVGIDDFGTGYSSLSYLQRFPVDQLKIDRSFVAPLGESASRSAIVGAVIDLAGALGQQVVAEGVEHGGQAAELARLGCDVAQGFLFAHAMPADDLSAMLAERARGAREPARAGR